MRTYAITIGGASKAIQSGWGITENANGRNRMDCAVLSIDGSYRPAIDSELVFTEDGTRIFGGLIDRPVETNAPHGNGSAALVMRVSVVDFNVYASRIRLTAEIPAGTFKAALTVVATALSAQGVTLAAGQVPGPDLLALSYTDRPINDALDEICALASGAGATSYLWEIDYSKVLEGWEAGTRAAPFDLADGDGNVDGDITVEQARASDYANYVIVLGGEGQRYIEFEPHSGDGVVRRFALNVPVASLVDVGLVGALRIDGGAGGYPVGNYGVDDMPWTFDTSTNEIVQRGDQTVIAVGHYIEMSYNGQYPVRVFADGGASAANRVMRTYAEAAVFDVTVLQALADSYVVRDMASPKTVRYSAIFSKVGLHPGQIQTITSAKRNLSGSHLITDVQILHIGGQLVQRQVTAVSTTRLPATLRQTFRSVFGGTSSGGSAAGIVTVISGGGIGGAGTAGTLPRWDTTTRLTDSIISQSGTTVTVAGTMAATMFSGSGASLTSVPADQLSGTIASATQDLITRAGTFVSGATGAGFTVALSTSTITGTLADARLSANVPLLNAANIFTLGQTINPAAVGNATLRYYVGGTQYGVVGLSGAIKGSAALDLGFWAATSQGMSWMVNGSATDAMTLSPAGLLTIAGTLGVTGLSTFTGGATVVSGQSLATGYSSGWAGSGYTLNVNSSFASQSYLEVDRLNVRGIMSVYELLVHQIRATNGSIFVANTGKAKTVTDNGGGSYTVETDGSHGFAVNDLIRAQRFTTAGGGAAVYQSDLTVSSVADTTHFTAALRSTYTAPAAGMEFVRLGNTTDADRQGSIYLTADDMNAPYINTLAGVAAFTDWGASAKIRSRIGNLNGSYGYTTTVYGAAFGDPATAWIKIDPTNGIRIGHGATTKISLSAAGDASFTGSVTASAGMIAGWTINTLSIAYDTGVTATSSGMAPADYPFYAGATYANRAVAVFRVTPAGALTATNATITGTITATSGAIGGWTISADSFRGGTGASTVGFIYDVGYTEAIWAGGADPTTAPFRVYKSGALIATNATITGAITATSGAIGGWIIGASQINDTAGTLIIKSGAVHASFIMVSDGVTNNAGIISGNVSGDVVIFAGGAFSNRATAPFRVTLGGALVATSATITGAITATSGSFTGSITAASGSIGGFGIGADYIRDAADSFGLASTVTAGVDVRFWAGATFANRATAPLRITEAGALVATSATITGAITGSTITGSTATFGGSGGETIINADGITVTSGTGFGNHYKFSDGSYLASVGDIMRLQADAGGSIELHVGSATVFWSGSAWIGSGYNLGSSTACWSALYIDPGTTTVAYYPLVHAGTLYGNAVLRKTNGYNGTVANPTSITIEYGIVTACS